MQNTGRNVQKFSTMTIHAGYSQKHLFLDMLCNPIGGKMQNF